MGTVTAICGTITAIVGLIIGIYKVYFSKNSKQEKWRKELYEIERQMDEAYAKGDERNYRKLSASRRLLIDKGRSLGFEG